jgi:GAF domain-containing protein
MLKEEKYQQILKAATEIVKGETNQIANLANLTALIHREMGFWWTGFYIVNGKELILGPFQGPVACTRIGFGKGVCGTAWKEKKTIIVPDVHLFPGHIACSSESNSEIVVPVFDQQANVKMVLDVDSTQYNCFDQTDANYLEKITALITSPA